MSDRPTFREALELLQRDFDARCETCAQWSTVYGGQPSLLRAYSGPGYGYCSEHGADMVPGDVCAHWEAKP